MQISIGKSILSFKQLNSNLDIRIPFIRIGKYVDEEGGVDYKIHLDFTTHIGYSSYDFGNSITFMILGFGIDYWWTNALEVIDEVEEDDED